MILFRFLSLSILGIFALRAGELIFEKSIPAELVTADSSGNAYAAGSSTVTKLSPSGNVVYSTNVSFTGIWSAIAVDSSGNILVAGTTQADDLPMTTGALQPKRNSNGSCANPLGPAPTRSCADGFIFKLDQTGKLSWATYLGGSSDDSITAVSSDKSGNIYVTGTTISSDFPIKQPFQATGGGVQDGFIAELNSSGTQFLYSSFLDSGGTVIPAGLAVDSAGNAFIAGQTDGGSFPGSMPAFGSTCVPQTTEAFLVKVAVSGTQMSFAGCLGESDTYTAADSVALDSTGSAYIAGQTNSIHFPVTAGAYQQQSASSFSTFVSKIASAGTSLVYSALFDGGPPGTALAVDATGAAYVAGPLFVATLPIVGPAFQTCPGAPFTPARFLIELNAQGSAVLYSSFDNPSATGIQLTVGPNGALFEAYAGQAGADSIRGLVNINQPGKPLVSQYCVVNGASLLSHADPGQPGISPGEAVSIFGSGLGPTDSSGAVLNNDTLANTVAGVQVLFDGTPAPLLYVRDGQINAVAPYGLTGKSSTSIQVTYNGQTSDPATLPVTTTSAAAFQDFTAGLPLVFNSDFTQNSASNPAHPGSAVVVFITGGGQTDPPSVDGQVWLAAGKLQTTVSAAIASIAQPSLTAPSQILYAGPVPSVVSAVQQINLSIPSSLPAGFFASATGNYAVGRIQVGQQMVAVPININ